jgi:Tol biopolymer transport system component
MTITSGTRLGPYEVVAPLGAGGMGEVWRGRDTRLERSVAIKILPAEFAENAQLKLRFEREAKTISQLNHPHICTLYDVGDGYLVMELLEGESLADRLTKGPLPIDQVLRYGIQVAEALEKAHKAGVVHRDLKPDNIMITKSGAKLLDFGLAKDAAALFDEEGPTRHRSLTAEGTIVGTFQYMAPEQLEGGQVDARTDIFALGAVLYEMATGKRAFEGKSKASLIASILTAEPQPISAIQPMTPASFDRLVRNCLQKDPDERFQSAHDVATELRWISEFSPAAAKVRGGHFWAAWIVAAALLASTAMFAYLWRRGTGEQPQRVEASIMPPAGSEFFFRGETPAVSPDGTRLVFPVRGADGRVLLWVRRLDNGVAQALPGTESPTYPFWSPDSRFIGFQSSGKLRKIDASGGPPEVISDAPVLRGASWGPSGDILFVPGDREPVYRVSSSGGPVTVVTRLDPGHEYSHRWPWFLPDGKHFLYLAQIFGAGGDRGRIYVGTLGSNDRKAVATANSAVAYSPTGHILFCRNRTLVAQPFDAKRLAVSGDPTPITDDMYVTSLGGVHAFSVSQSRGILTYFKATGGGSSQLAWKDRTGKTLGTVGSPGDYQRPQLAHDGRRVAFEIWDSEAMPDIWIYDMARQTSTRFTFGPANNNAIWSPDDHFLVYATEQLQRGTRDVVRKRSTGVGTAELLFGSAAPGISITDWSPDGRYLIFHTVEAHSKTSVDVYGFSLPDRKTFPLVQSAAVDCCSRLSRDGRWLAYTSAESGRAEVYVQPFPVATGKWLISSAGGAQARWSADGKEIFYASPDNKIMAVELHTDSGTFEVGAPKPLFSIHPRAGGWPFDVSRDGRFLINETIGDQTGTPITVVLNWTANLNK